MQTSGNHKRSKVEYSDSIQRNKSFERDIATQIPVTCDSNPTRNKKSTNIQNIIIYIYRYLDLRAKAMQSNFKLRSDFVQAVRTFLTNEKFLDIETPTLFRRTPGGAREFIVPTRIDKSFFSLTQSPQQFKQLLMVAGFDRYFQIARCYRDEELKADRQPEFTQIDLEMSFIDEADCMDLIEKLFASCWPYRSDLTVPFKRITYDDAIALYGSDKPDVRFGFEIHRATDYFRTNQCGISKIDAAKSADVEAFFIKIPCQVCANDQMLNVNGVEKILTGELKKNNLTNTTCLIFNKTTGNYLTKYFNENFRNAFARSSKTEPDDLIVMLIGDSPRLDILETLGRFRVAVADHIDTENSKIKTIMPRLRDPNKYEFRWIVDFPLFTYDNTKKRFESTHHPFTAPKDNQINMIYQKTNLDRILGKHYDLVSYLYYF
jgi:aspartyl-tRNA synthetase